MASIKKITKQLRKERDEEIKLAHEAKKRGDLETARGHALEAIALERSALRLERFERLKHGPITDLPGVRQMEKRK